MSLGLLLAASLAQTPDQQEKDAAAPLQAWQEAVTCLRDPNRRNEADGHFRAAARAYEHYRHQYGEYPHSLLWLGFSYHAAGDLPHAIAAYRRGLAIDPAYLTFLIPKLHAALAHARAEVQYPPAPDLARLMRPERDYWPGWLSLRSLGVYAFILYFVACLAVTRWRMTRRRLCLWVAVTAAVIALVPVVGSGVEWLRRQRDDATPVVVLARSELLRTGNGTEYPPRLDVPLPRGAEVRRLFERAGWYQVQLSGGPVGWLPREAVVEEY